MQAVRAGQAVHIGGRRGGGRAACARARACACVCCSALSSNGLKCAHNSPLLELRPSLSCVGPSTPRSLLVSACCCGCCTTAWPPCAALGHAACCKSPPLRVRRARGRALLRQALHPAEWLRLLWHFPAAPHPCLRLQEPGPSARVSAAATVNGSCSTRPSPGRAHANGDAPPGAAGASAGAGSSGRGLAVPARAPRQPHQWRTRSPPRHAHGPPLHQLCGGQWRRLRH